MLNNYVLPWLYCDDASGVIPVLSCEGSRDVVVDVHPGMTYRWVRIENCNESQEGVSDER